MELETTDSDTKPINSSSSSPSPQNQNEKEKWCGHEFLYEFQGFWFTKTYLETTKKVMETFKPLPTDIILASFPKTGTTWLKALLYSITHRNDAALKLIHPQELVPSLETNLFARKQIQGAPQMQQFLHQIQGSSRILATHAPHQILGDLLNSCHPKIVYVTRNPKDALISLWHFLQKSKQVEEDPWLLEAAVDQFCNGVVPFGPYYDHVLAYRQQSLERPDKVLFVTYEDLTENTGFHVRKLGEFLGCPFVGGDDDDDGERQVEEIVKMCSFDVLSNQEVNKSTEFSESGFPLPYNSFFRKGQVGDHVSYLGDEMIRKIDHVTTLKFHAAGFHYGI